jgi:hypothetical protein
MKKTVQAEADITFSEAELLQAFEESDTLTKLRCLRNLSRLDEPALSAIRDFWRNNPEPLHNVLTEIEANITKIQDCCRSQ